MDEKRQDDEISPRSSSQHCLFPISSSRSEGVQCTSRQATLFPSVGAIKNEKKQETDLSWLKNESYIPEYFQNVVDEDESSSDDSTSEEEATTEKIPKLEEKLNIAKERSNAKSYHHEKRKKKHSKKRRYSDSDSDIASSSGESARKQKCRKKHKKQKLKKKEKGRSDSDDEEKIHKPNTIWIEDSGLSTEDAFRIHRKPDMENLMYGCLYRLDVALFKIRKNTCCLGLGKQYNVSSDKRKSKKKALESRYWRSTEMFSQVPESIKPCGKSTKFFVGNVENYSYLPIDLPSKRGEENERRVKGRERELDDGSATDGSEESLMAQRTAELNKILRENPHDVKKWIEFVKFQTEAINNEDISRVGYTATGNERKRKNSQIIKEKQISVLEKALEVNPSSTELIIYHLELCSDIWEESQLLDRWRKVVFVYPNKTVLWREYLSFVQSRFSTFTFRKAQRVYDKCFGTLLPIKEGTFMSHQAEEGIEEDMLDLFVQHCKFMKQSGHTEKAVACFQAMVELNCLCPSELSESTSTSELLAFLETFWDAGQPRFGETGAVGWTTWMSNSLMDKKPLGSESLDLKKIFKALDPTKRKEVEPQSTTEKEEQMVKGMQKWKAWVKVEISRDNSQLKPWQPDAEKGETDEDCEDPERLVIFDDVSTYLFKLEKMVNRLKLVLHFLELLGVPVTLMSSSQSFEAQRLFKLSVHTPEQVIKGQQQFLTPGFGWQMSEHWQTDQEQHEHEQSGRPAEERLQMVRNIFLQSLSLFQGVYKDHLMMKWLWYEFSLSQMQESEKSRKQAFKEVYKLAKALLKVPSNRNNLSLWKVFANILALSGDVAEARRVFDSTLALASQVVETDQKGSLAPLYRAYAELELKESVSTFCSTIDKPALTSSKRALHLLVSLTEDSKYEPMSEDATSSMSVSPARILKAKRNYAELCENLTHRINNSNEREDNSFLEVESSVHAVVCCALFSYVSSGIQAASAIYDKVLSSLSLANDVVNVRCEQLWTSYLNLLNLHAKKEPLPLKTIRVVLRRALKDYPNNSYFLDCFLQVESKSNLTGEVRRFFDHLIHDASSPVPWIYAIHYENVRSKALVSTLDCAEYITKQPSSILVTSLPVTGISHRQRALLDRATSSVAGQQCVALWKMYMEFELHQGNKEQAKAIFYQALQHCPWAKILYLHAVKAFPDDLQSIIDLMDEKELRVRTPLEEIEILMESQ